jgi:hypothetical protein
MEVWLAHDVRLDRQVRIELPRSTGGADDELNRQHFWHYVQGAAHGRQDDGPRVLDAGTDAATGEVFLVREWVESSVQQPDRAADAPKVAGGRVATAVAPAPVIRRAVPAPARTGPRSGPIVSRRWLTVLGALIVLGIVGTFAASGVRAWLAWVNEPAGTPGSILGVALTRPVATPNAANQASAATATPVGPPPTIAPAGRPATAASTPASVGPTGRPAAVASPSAAAQGERRRIVNTDGQGVALRTAPDGERLPARGYDEGTTVTVLERQGAWTHIRGDDGRDGWVLSVTVSQ